MVSNHGKKQRARKRAARTGASHASAVGGTLHDHSMTDTDLIDGMMPYVDGWESDVELATRLVGACWTGCRPCRDSLSKQVVANSRATLAGLAGACYLTLPGTAVQHSPKLSPATRAWAATAHHKAFTAGAEAALRAVGELSTDDARVLLEDTLDHWMGARSTILDMFKGAGHSDTPPGQQAAGTQTPSLETDPACSPRTQGPTPDDDDIGPWVPAEEPSVSANSRGSRPWSPSPDTSRKVAG